MAAVPDLVHLPRGERGPLLVLPQRVQLWGRDANRWWGVDRPTGGSSQANGYWGSYRLTGVGEANALNGVGEANRLTSVGEPTG